MTQKNTSTITLIKTSVKKAAEFSYSGNGAHKSTNKQGSEGAI
ncbi:MAG: hypothetical protein ACI97K_000771 [Glaciecola sp.]|jgi:hypothetical protein